jgi:hypothetical protein
MTGDKSMKVESHDNSHFSGQIAKPECKNKEICTARHSTAQHSTAQHSIAQHTTAQHST